MQENFPESCLASDFAYITYLFWHFLHSLTALMGLGIHIFKA